MKKTQNVVIKGTKNGLTLHLNDDCSYEDIKQELEKKLSLTSREHEDRPLLPVIVEIGNRYLSKKQQEELKDLVRTKKNLVVDKIVSNVITIEEAEKLKAEEEVVTVARIVRSGQVLEVTGDLLLIGDVNPGGTVRAGGNIFVMGALRGIAHAGCNGNEQAVITASLLSPSQLRIGDCINRAPDQEPNDGTRTMECAYISENQQIVVDRLQVLMHVRPNLTKLEGGR